MNRKVEHRLRSFGMSGYLITDELREIESTYELDLGHVLPSSTDQSKYYPQFELEVRAEASRMSEHYEVFYCLETSIRKLISDTLHDAESAQWWESERVPEVIKKSVEKNQKREIDSGVTRRSEQQIDYTTFGELSVIITSNWDLFGTIFNSQQAVERVMKSLNLLRGPIAHCCPISDDEVDRLRLAVKDWFRMMA